MAHGYGVSLEVTVLRNSQGKQIMLDFARVWFSKNIVAESKISLLKLELRGFYCTCKIRQAENAFRLALFP